MKNLDLLVLADRESSVCRAYLSYLKDYGYRPKKALLIDFLGESKKNDVLTKLLGRWITSRLIRLYRIFMRFLQVDRSGWITLAKSMDAQFEHSVPFFGNFKYSDYAHEVESIVVNGFDDPRLLSAVKHSGIRTLLFTGGGLVKLELLNLPGIKIIHIHPGIVPDIKGADGILWSALLRGKLGYSGFYMSVGIDTGEVLIKREYDLPKFDARMVEKAGGFDDMYRALLFSFDAHMRAITLIKLIKTAERDCRDLSAVPGGVQNPNDGRTYYFMHTLLRDAGLRKMLR